jgi:hypothetical protein
MVALLVREERYFLTFCAAGLAGLIVWWTAMAYSGWSTRHLVEQVRILASERDNAQAKYQRLHETAEKLVELEEKLALVRVEAGQKVETPASKPIVPVPDSLTLLMNDLEQKTDGMTGSIRHRKKAKAAGGKPRPLVSWSEE